MIMLLMKTSLHMDLFLCGNFNLCFDVYIKFILFLSVVIVSSISIAEVNKIDT